MSQGNLLAYLALVAFPLLAVFLFKRFRLDAAIVWTISLGYLFLPVRTWFDLPIGPVLDKASITSLTALVLACVVSKRHPQLFPKSKLIRILIFSFIISSFATAYFNQNPLTYGVTRLPGLSPFSGAGISAIALDFFILIPLFLGRQFLDSKESLTTTLKIFALIGTVYTLIVLWEIRMSPQLHTNIYGYFPHAQFLQQMRQDGFRSVGFLGHGLLTSLLLVVTLSSLLCLAKKKINTLYISSSILAVYLLIVLILNKSLAFLIYAVVLLVFSLLLNDRTKRLAILMMCAAVIFYPAIRGTDFFPAEKLESLASSYNEDRAASLKFRFDNEDLLLAKAQLKPIFGWGAYGRNRIYDEYGRDVSVSDGEWIIILGTRGWFGFIAVYGIFVVSILYALKSSQYEKESRAEILYLCSILGIVLVNTLPNSGIFPMIWLVCGSLIGNSERVLNRGKTASTA